MLAKIIEDELGNREGWSISSLDRRCTWNLQLPFDLSFLNMLRAVPRVGQSTTRVIRFLTILQAAYPVPPRHDLEVEAGRCSEYCKLLTELRAHIFLENPCDPVAARVTSEPLVVEDSLDRETRRADR